LRGSETTGFDINGTALGFSTGFVRWMMVSN